jgi:hypothetical protein
VDVGRTRRRWREVRGVGKRRRRRENGRGVREEGGTRVRRAQKWGKRTEDEPLGLLMVQRWEK